jgi:hypothetical protein
MVGSAEGTPWVRSNVPHELIEQADEIGVDPLS